MCILLCYTYSACPHIAKSGIYTCYAAKTSGRGFDERCSTFKITSQKLRWKKEAKRCAPCLEAFGEKAPVRRKRVGKIRNGKRDERKGESGTDDGDGAGQVKELVKGGDLVKGEKAVDGEKIMKLEQVVNGEKVDGEDSKDENQVLKTLMGEELATFASSDPMKRERYCGIMLEQWCQIKPSPSSPASLYSSIRDQDISCDEKGLKGNSSKNESHETKQKTSEKEVDHDSLLGFPFFQKAAFFPVAALTLDWLFFIATRVN
ncbi:hypothetical protein BKA64DRAFT_644569 [Cadophora sp. MPI-SDFR-AT-0126]|nr:hypothetical protein BKA64DRAFT_644569 [Leotiomycetes sp. MPI-SDFR-AT-0126]